MSLIEVADRIWVRRFPSYDVSAVIVGGARGLVVIDTLATVVEAEDLLADLGRLDRGAPVAVVNTHDHFDHVLGNAALRAAHPDIPIHATETAAAATDPAAPPADQTFASAAVIDLGDRQLELVHLGRGHTAGDLVVRVPDADVLVAGDLVEESAPPAFGADCWPLDWPATLDLALGMTTAATTVIPGHGAPVGRAFVEDQCDQIRAVAETIRELATAGTPLARALAAATWPYPTELLEHAVRRGYEQLPPQRRQLPLA